MGPSRSASPALGLPSPTPTFRRQTWTPTPQPASRRRHARTKRLNPSRRWAPTFRRWAWPIGRCLQGPRQSPGQLNTRTPCLWRSTGALQLSLPRALAHAACGWQDCLVTGKRQASDALPRSARSFPPPSASRPCLCRAGPSTARPLAATAWSMWLCPLMAAPLLAMQCLRRAGWMTTLATSGAAPPACCACPTVPCWWQTTMPTPSIKSPMTAAQQSPRPRPCPHRAGRQA